MTIDFEDMKCIEDKMDRFIAANNVQVCNEIDRRIEANNIQFVMSHIDFTTDMTGDFKKRIEALEQDLNFLKRNMFDWIKFPSEIQDDNNECTEQM